MVATKAPKSKHYSASGSLKRRVSCAVAQKNEGRAYLCDVNQRAGVSPGEVFGKFAKSLDRKIKNDNIRKHRKTTKDVSLLRYTFQSSCVVYFDLETSGLDHQAEIIQIAASYNGATEDSFLYYIRPSQQLSRKIEDLTGITFDTESQEMHHYGKRVHCVELEVALANFTEWLEPVQPVILVAHNCKSFDIKKLVKAILSKKLEEKFDSVVSGFGDSLPFFREFHPQLPNHKLETIVSALLTGNVFNLHNATEDVLALRLLCQASTTFESLVKYTFSLQSVCDMLHREMLESENLPSLQPLVTAKILPSGLPLEQLKVASEWNICSLHSTGNLKKVFAYFSLRRIVRGK